MILVFGTICLDRMQKIPHLPAIGGYVEVLEEQVFLGGEAANTANALKVWGADVLLAGNGLGDDERLPELLAARGIPISIDQVIRPGQTPVCDVFVSDDGERTMIGHGFAQMDSTVDPLRLPYKTGEWFTAEPNMEKNSREAVRLAHQHGMKIYTMDFVLEDDPIFPGSFWQASTDWTGTRDDPEASLAWLSKLINRNGCFGILTDGPTGFFAGSPEVEPVLYPALPLDQMVDATGAGDAFRAGMLYGLDQDWEIDRCLRFASAAGCLACTHLGAAEYVPSLSDIRKLLSAPY